MFYTAEAALPGKGLSFSKHSAVIAAFGLHFVKPGMVRQDLQRSSGTSPKVSLYETSPTTTSDRRLSGKTRNNRFLALEPSWKS
jgi:uncharacterized protein (UPF0332 family)